MELGLHFRLTDAEAAPILAAAGDGDRLHDLLAVLEEDADVFARACESDKAWDPIACALAPEGEQDAWPARGVIGGARSLQSDGDELWVTHLSPEEVGDVASYLAGLSDADFSAAYEEMPESLRNPEYGEEEEAFALSWLEGLRRFYRAADEAAQHVVFTVGF